MQRWYYERELLFLATVQKLHKSCLSIVMIMNYDMLNFWWINRKWLAGSNVTKPAVAGAYIPANHESSRPGSPTFPTIGTHPARANGVNMMLVEQPYYLFCLESSRKFYLKPFRFATEISLWADCCIVFHVYSFLVLEIVCRPSA